MPLPWKKAKVSRISRIMADLQPPKPRSSMVVETGFPTSIIDLFVKNSDRLKKPIKKKHKKNQNQPPVLSRVVEELFISDLSASKDSLSEEPILVNNFDGNHNIPERFENLVGQIPNQDHDQSLEGCGSGDMGTVSHGDERGVVFYGVLMMFVTAVLALSIKKLAIGITFSALLLLFLEYTGKHFLCFLQPCSNFRVSLQPLIQSPYSFFSLIKDLWVSNSVLLKSGSWAGNEEKKGLIIKVDCEVVEEERKEKEAEGEKEKQGDNDDLLESTENSSREEIQVDEARLDVVAREGILSYGKRWGHLDMETVEEGSEHIIHEEEHIHRSKIRRKIIKKLVPKKLRTMKKARKEKYREEDVSSEVSSHSGEAKLCSSEESEEQHNISRKWKLTLLHLVEEEREVEKCEGSIDLQTKSKEPIVVEKVNEEDVNTQKEENRGSLFLFLMVLAALVGGRFLALSLTFASCLVILVRRERRECVRKTPASMSS